MKKTENYLRYCMYLIFSNIQAIILIICLFTLVGAAGFYILQKKYTVTGSFLVRSKKIPSTPTSDGKQNYAILPPAIEDVLLETRLITDSRLVILTVNELINEKKISVENIKSDTNVSPTDMIISAVQENLKATVFPGSNVIDVKLALGDSAHAYNILERLLDNYPRFRASLFSEQYVSDFYDEQLIRYRANIDSINKTIVSAMEKSGISDVEKELEINLKLLISTSEEQERLQQQYSIRVSELNYLRNIIAKYESVEKGEQTQLPPPIQLGVLDDGRRKINEMLLNKYEEIGKYSSMSGNLKEKASKLKNELLNVIVSEEEALKTLASILEEKKRRIEFIKRESIRLKSTGFNIQNTMNEGLLMQKKYENFMTKKEDNRLENTSDIYQYVNVQVMTRPNKPLEPSSPGLLALMIVGFSIGIMVSFAFIWIKEITDHTFKVPVQVDEILGVPVICSIFK